MEKTLREIIESDFEGFERKKLEFWSPDDLPNYHWSNDYDGIDCEYFSKGEDFEQIAIRTWICTDSLVGFHAILWNKELLAFTYQGGRKSDKEWFFVDQDGEERMYKCFLSYQETKSWCESPVIPKDDPGYSRLFSPDQKYDWRTGPMVISPLPQEGKFVCSDQKIQVLYPDGSMEPPPKGWNIASPFNLSYLD